MKWRLLWLGVCIAVGVVIYRRLRTGESDEWPDEETEWVSPDAIPPAMQQAAADVRQAAQEDGAAEDAATGPPSGASAEASGEPAGAAAGPIKGNVRNDDKIYHMPGDPQYDITKAEMLFNSEEEAQAAGYRRAGRPRSAR